MTSHPVLAASTSPRRVALPDGRVLVVRPVTAEDVDGLAELYARLSDADRHRRFFSTYHPDRAFLYRMATVGDRGGFGLVATVGNAEGDGGAEPIVAEAGYCPLANGDGEFAITVDAEWRGGLGTYLFDALLDAAATRGVPNLEGDILSVNQRMLALVRARGCATVCQPDRMVVRAIVGAAGPTPTWPGRHDHLRVLVESPGGSWPAGAAADADADVLACPGPGTRRLPCPALAGRPCPLAAGADVIVVSPPPDDDWRPLLDAHRQLHPGVPVEPSPRAKEGV